MHYDNYNLHCVISIHALLAESDLNKITYQRQINQFLSTLSLRRATCITTIIICTALFLSTLSLRRATLPVLVFTNYAAHFYPRSPCGERLYVWCFFRFGSADFYPRSPCGERRVMAASITPTFEFLSTLSLRRATRGRRVGLPVAGHFYPRSPCGERRLHR